MDPIDDHKKKSAAIAREGEKRLNEHVKYASVLLDREPEPGYADEWTQLLMREKVEVKKAVRSSAVIFKLGTEWLALTTMAFQEVAETRVVHKLPHRTGKYLLGLVNVCGRLRQAVSMHHMLEITPLEAQVKVKESGRTQYHRLLVIENGKDQWVFPVDEVYGIFKFDSAGLENVPVTVSKSTANFLKGMLVWEKRLIGLIDEQLLFNSLRRIVV